MAVSVEASTESFEQFLEESRREYEQTQRELKEVDLLIQQTTAEVERLAQRNTQATNRLRQIEAALDTVPREDIREAYAAVRVISTCSATCSSLPIVPSTSPRFARRESHLSRLSCASSRPRSGSVSD